MPRGLKRYGRQGDLHSRHVQLLSYRMAETKEFNGKFNINPKTRALRTEPGAPSAFLCVVKVKSIACNCGGAKLQRIFRPGHPPWIRKEKIDGTGRQKRRII